MQTAVLSNNQHGNEQVLVLEREPHATAGADSGDGYGPTAYMPLIKPVLFPRVHRASFPWCPKGRWWRAESAMVLVAALTAARSLTQRGVPARLVDYRTAESLDRDRKQAAPGYASFAELAEPTDHGPYEVILLDLYAK